MTFARSVPLTIGSSSNVLVEDIIQINSPHWDARDTVNHLLDKTITEFNVVVDRSLARPRFGDKVNHWRLFLRESPSAERFIVVEVLKTSGTDVISRVHVNYFQYRLDYRDVVIHFQLRLAQREFTVKHFLDSIKNSGFHRYMYTAGGEGCRFWTNTVVQKFEDDGLLASGSQERLNGYIQYLWHSWDNYERKRIAEGKFY
ncbi:hypothetical protein OBBRIDRAFT_889454 [Obba rivulosa]|uniref:DUF7770 domain-containing protein n=1 Tax=Obba rivulosa TaxID=1052685 RepID=A0A8E2DJJ6_9APHY|nr:hypothetical protein OBBRIDRAFT_889454 [Obba rivulosa]